MQCSWSQHGLQGPSKDTRWKKFNHQNILRPSAYSDEQHGHSWCALIARVSPAKPVPRCWFNIAAGYSARCLLYQATVLGVYCTRLQCSVSIVPGYSARCLLHQATVLGVYCTRLQCSVSIAAAVGGTLERLPCTQDGELLCLLQCSVWQLARLTCRWWLHQGST